MPPDARPRGHPAPRVQRRIGGGEVGLVSAVTQVVPRHSGIGKERVSEPLATLR